MKKNKIDCIGFILILLVMFSGSTAFALTATADSSGASNPPSNAVDGDGATYWRGLAQGSGWLALDLGSEMAVRGVRVNLGRDVIDDHGTAVDYTIQVSVDNVSWVTVQTVTENTFRLVDHSFTPLVGRYVRINILKTIQAGAGLEPPSISEFEVVTEKGTGDKLSITGESTVNVYTPSLPVKLLIHYDQQMLDLLSNPIWKLTQIDLLDADDQGTSSTVTPDGNAWYYLDESSVPGTYYVEVALYDSSDLIATGSLYYAFTPAPDAADLPNDWPLGMHLMPYYSVALPAGFKTMRSFVFWQDLEPSKGVYDWRRTDYVVRKAALTGHRVNFIFEQVPVWAVANPTVINTPAWHPTLPRYPRVPDPPDDLGDLKNFLEAFWTRYASYGGEGGVIEALEVWNEPNVTFTGTWSELAAFTEVFRTVGEAYAPAVKIVGISESGGNYIGMWGDLFDLGLLDNVDALAKHTYHLIADPILFDTHIMQRQQVVQSYGGSQAFWMTEGGITAESQRVNKRPVDQVALQEMHEAIGIDPNNPHRLITGSWRNVSEERKAALIPRATIQGLALGVDKFMWYRLHAREHSFVRDTPEGMIPGLIVVTHGALANFLQGLKYKEKIAANLVVANSGIDVYAFKFGNESRDMTVVWGYNNIPGIYHLSWDAVLEPRDIDVPVASGIVEVFDMYGRPVNFTQQAGSVRVQVGEHPVYIIRVTPGNDGTLIGPGSDITDATSTDTYGQQRLIVDRAAINLEAGSYDVTNFSLFVASASGTKTITPMLLTGSPSSYTTLWVGEAYDPTISNTIQDVPQTTSFSLAAATEVYAGFFTSVTGSDIIYLNVNNSGTGNSVTDYDVTFTAPTGVGETVENFSSMGHSRTYAFSIDVSFGKSDLIFKNDFED
ncbi:MAG: discoidin domain-containing protein [Xanthomonadales bacterium]|nr:discoidin domain-containing protein [Xanthomonadales bacterium]